MDYLHAASAMVHMSNTQPAVK